MTKVLVKGSEWDVASIDGQIVTFVTGETTKVSHAVAAGITKLLAPKKKRRSRKKSD